MEKNLKIKMKRVFLIACFALVTLFAGCGLKPVYYPQYYNNQAPNPVDVPSNPSVSSASQVQTLLLFGGPSHKVFLGCLNCGKYDLNSVWNKFGTYGGRYSSFSIWNKYGTYGSIYSNESPWNKFAQSPPAIVDRDGNFYGYFTANKYLHNRTTIKVFTDILDSGDSFLENYENHVDGMH
jgi:predicted small lipoprotein YifL